MGQIWFMGYSLLSPGMGNKMYPYFCYKNVNIFTYFPPSIHIVLHGYDYILYTVNFVP